MLMLIALTIKIKKNNGQLVYYNGNLNVAKFNIKISCSLERMPVYTVIFYLSSKSWCLNKVIEKKNRQ